MVKMTDQNLELNDQVVEMKSTIEELEQLRDLSEEMDAQNAEIYSNVMESTNQPTWVRRGNI